MINRTQSHSPLPRWQLNTHCKHLPPPCVQKASQNENDQTQNEYDEWVRETRKSQRSAFKKAYRDEILESTKHVGYFGGDRYTATPSYNQLDVRTIMIELANEFWLACFESVHTLDETNAKWYEFHWSDDLIKAAQKSREFIQLTAYRSE